MLYAKKIKRRIFHLIKHRWLKPFRNKYQYHKLKNNYLTEANKARIFGIISHDYSKPLSDKDKRKINREIITDYIKYGASINDYLFYEFYRKSDLEKRKFVTEKMWKKLWHDLNPDRYRYLFDEKHESYKLFKPYFGREILWVKNEVSFEMFEAFCQKHNEIIVKPHNGKNGEGIWKTSIDSKTDLKNLFHQCQSNRNVVEQVIDQHPEIKSFHPPSINTLRITTLVINGEARIISAVFRIGNQGRVVDNALSGGIMAAVDIETGMVFTRGFDRKNQWYHKHPMTNQQIVGFQFPFWDKILRIIKELTSIVPFANLVGWDIAITSTDEIILIEGNYRPGYQIQQMADQVGKLKFYEEAIKR